MFKDWVAKMNGKKNCDVQRFRSTEYGFQTVACKSKNAKVVA